MFNPHHLVPVADLNKMRIYNDVFRYEEAVAFLNAKTALDAGHFSFNRSNMEFPYCYYKEYLFIDFLAFTEKNLEKSRLPEEIAFHQQRLHSVLADKDFSLFFSLIHERLALYAYQELFPQLSELQKSSIFWFIVNRCQMDARFFPQDFLKCLASAASIPLQAFKSESGDDIPVYIGFDSQEKIDLKQTFNWSADINSAIDSACTASGPGKIFMGRIAPDNILHYHSISGNRKIQKIVLNPDAVKNLEEVNLLTLQKLLRRLDEKRLWFLFRQHIAFLKPDYFNNPYGIHGVSHTKRVLFLCLILSFLLKISEDELKCLCLCSVYHDIGRENDNWDQVHGINSVKKGLSLGLFDGLSSKTVGLISYIIENHCIDDKYLEKKAWEYNLENPQRALQLLKIFKDADGLDRIRISDLDLKRLRHKQAADLILIARQLHNHQQFDSYL
jgi:hypothetical protein